MANIDFKPWIPVFVFIKKNLFFKEFVFHAEDIEFLK